MRSTGVGDTLVKQRNDSSELFSLSLVIDRLVSYFYNRQHFDHDIQVFCNRAIH